MKTYKHIILGVCAASAAACGASDTKSPPVGGLATIEGRLVQADAHASTATVVTVDDQGRETPGASGAVAADGHFEIEGVEPGEGPFLVRITGSGSAAATVATVIVPEDLAAGDHVTTMPADQETSVEAAALVSLLAGAAARDDIDTIALMTWIDAELAVEQGDSAGALGAAFWSAQEGWLALASGVRAEETEDAKMNAWGELTATVSATGDASDRGAAWQRFIQESQAALATQTSITFAQQSDAQAVAAVLFEAALSDDALARDAAVRIGAELSAHAAWAAQVEASAGSSAESAVVARLDAAYEGFFAALAAADDREEMGAAWVSLSGAISGYGADDGSSSALELLVGAEGGESVEAAAEAAMKAGAEARAALEADIDLALGGSAETRAAGVAEAYADFRAEVTAGVQAALGAGAGRLEAFVVAASTQLSGHLSVVFELDLLADVTVGESIVGTIAPELRASLEGAVATLLSIEASGVVHTVATGVIADGTYRFDDVAELGGTLVITLRGAGDVIVGAGALAVSGTTTGETIAGPTLTSESTVEAQILLERVANGERPSAIDMTWVELFIDGDVAAATHGEADLAALVLATVAAESVTEGATQSSARAHAEAALAFAIASSSATGASDDLQSATDARAAIEAALALESGVHAVAEGSSFAAHEGALGVAVDSFIATTSEASSASEADAAAGVFVDALLGFSTLGSGDVGLLGGLSTELGLDLVAQASVQSAITASFAAAATFETSVRAAFTTATSGGDVAYADFAAAWSGARASLDAALAVALELPTVTLSGADREALATLVTHLALSFHGDFDGSFER